MQTEVDDIVEKALKLSPSIRAYLAEMLLESLDYEDDFPISNEWLVEIQRRCNELDNREVLSIPSDQALAYLQTSG